MNDLQKKIESLLEHSLPIIPDSQVKKLTKALSQFFLEEIKGAYIIATREVLSENVYSLDKIKEDADIYLKSKYNIED